LIVAPCGFNLQRSLREIPILEALPGWFDLKAVQDGRVAFADGNKYFNRSGTTIVETAQILAEILHDRSPAQRWRGVAWLRYHGVSEKAAERL
jgi:iron complex transport system substrate-binding protein